MKVTKCTTNGAALKKFFAFFMMLLLGALVFPAVNINAVDMEDNDGMFYSDFNSFEEVTEAALALNIRVAEEAIILMKNDGVLPFKDVEMVSVLGKNSIDLAYGGGGSGSGNTATAKSLFDSLEAAGFSVNQKLRNFYQDMYDSGIRRSVTGMGGGGRNEIGEVPIEFYTREITETFKIYNDAAVIIITRSGAEGDDNGRTDIVDHESPDMHYLELSQDELDMIELAKANFDNIVVVINNSSPLELGVLEDDPAINAIVWIGHPGNNGIMALGRVLNGEVNPSGRTPDIYARDFTLDPTFQNFGNNSQVDGAYRIAVPGELPEDDPVNISGPRGAVPVLMYEEGIYLGYRYYETRGVEESGTWYEDNVVYPFGYGLSYTTFAWEIVQSTNNLVDLDKDGVIEIDVKVTNTGEYPGKDVVELYFTAPYITGEIEKAHVVLAGFAKTKTLQPGKSQTVTLTLHVQDMASYDYNDANGNGHFGYELDEGTHTVKLMENSHDVVFAIDYTVPTGGFQYTTSRITGNDIENRFSDGKFDSLPKEDGVTMDPVMSRADFAGTFPTTPTIEDVTIPADSSLIDVVNYIFSLDDVLETDSWYRSATDAVGISQVSESTLLEDRTITYMLQDMMGVAKDDPKWTTLLNELKWTEVKALAAMGRYATARMDIIGKNQDSNQDGPAGSRGGIYWASETVIAATWNVEIVEQFGIMIGNESLWLNIQGWYAPAMNIHRSPFSGRNFEYYSEDGFLSGKMASAATKGAQSKGLYVYLKHFAMNDQETDRMSILTYVNEQTMREIYLKAFQIPVEEGKANAVMSAFNYIGDRPAAQNYALLTEILRDEWGFNGVVVTDYYSGGQGTGAYMNINEQIVMGNDIPLGTVSINNIFGTYDETLNAVVYNSSVVVDDPETPDVNESIIPSYTFWLAGRQAALNVLYVAANSNSVKNGVSFEGFGGEINVYERVNNNINLVPEALIETGVNYTVLLNENSTLPEGLSLTSDGRITGTPQTVGTYTVSLNPRAYDWVTGGNVTYTINVLPAFTFTGDSVDSLFVGNEFTTTVGSDVYIENPNYSDPSSPDYRQGYANFTYSVRYDSLPAGLSMSSDGVITGTPIEGGEFDVTLRLTYTYYNRRDRTASIDFYVTMIVGQDPITLDTSLVNIEFADADVATAVTGHVGLPAKVGDIYVFWTSSNQAVITNSGVVTRGETDQVVTLTAHMIQGDLVATKDYELTVLAAEPTLSLEDVQAYLATLNLLSESEIEALIAAIDLLTEAEVEALIAANVLTESDVIALINARVLTEAQVNTLIDAKVLTQAQVIALIEARVLTEAQVQALIEAEVLTEAQVQALIDASLPEEAPDTGCGSQTNASASIIIFTFIGLLGLFFVRKRF